MHYNIKGYEELYILEGVDNKIRATAKGTVEYQNSIEKHKNPPNWIEEDFDKLLKWRLKQYGLRDAGFGYGSTKEWSNKIKDEYTGLPSSRLLTSAQAFFILTGVDIDRATYLFKWNGQDLFTMRPGYGEMCLRYCLEEPYINEYEKALLYELEEYDTKITKIREAIREEDFLDEQFETAPFDKWINLFRSLDFDLQHIPQEYLTGPVVNENHSGQPDTTDKLYSGIREITAAMKAHKFNAGWKQIKNYKPLGLNIIDTPNGKKTKPTLLESDIREFVRQRELKKNEKK